MGEDVKPGDGQPIENCQFCLPDVMSGFNHFADRGLQRLDTLRIVETPNFFVVPDLLPVHPNGAHVVMIPKQHVYSYAQLDQGLGEEAQGVVGQLEIALDEQFVLFEHGGVKHGGKIMSVYHAHAHLIGSMEKDVLCYMSEVLEREGIDFETVPANHNPIRNIQNHFRNQGYFYIQQNGSAIIAHDPKDALPSQLAQRNMSQLLTGEQVDWKSIHSNPRFANLSIERISRLMQKLHI